MRVQDNRHLDFSNILHIGDVVLCKDGNHYQFIANEFDEEVLPYIQVNVHTGRVVDLYPHSLFTRLGIGSDLEIGGYIEEITKLKDLVLELRK